MWRCSRIMHMLRDLHPTLLSALEGIVDQMVWFRECWHEDVLRQLRQGLAKCYQVAFEYRADGEIIFLIIMQNLFKYFFWMNDKNLSSDVYPRLLIFVISIGYQIGH